MIMTNDFIEQKLKEFDEEWDDNFGNIDSDRYRNMKQFIKKALSQMITPEQHQKTIDLALEQQREKIVKEVFEVAHYYTEREILLMPDDMRMLANQHNARLDKLKSEQEECKCHCHLSGMHYSKGSERCVCPIVSCTHCQKPEEMEV